MNYILKIFACLLCLAIIVPLSSCGKVSDPQPLEGSGYPHSYPRR